MLMQRLSSEKFRTLQKFPLIVFSPQLWKLVNLQRKYVFRVVLCVPVTPLTATHSHEKNGKFIEYHHQLFSKTANANFMFGEEGIGRAILLYLSLTLPISYIFQFQYLSTEFFYLFCLILRNLILKAFTIIGFLAIPLCFFLLFLLYESKCYAIWYIDTSSYLTSSLWLKILNILKQHCAVELSVVLEMFSALFKFIDLKYSVLRSHWPHFKCSKASPV